MNVKRVQLPRAARQGVYRVQVVVVAGGSRTAFTRSLRF
jgi:hypothetical protein